MAGEVTPIESIKYKYLVSVDGWTAAWERVPWILQSKSLLLKQDSPIVEWFTYLMNPMVHYYPIKSDISNIAETVEWLRTHDKTTEQIAGEGTYLAMNIFREEKILEEFYNVLDELAEIQNYTVPAAIQLIVKNSEEVRPLEYYLTLSEQQLK